MHFHFSESRAQIRPNKFTIYLKRWLQNLPYRIYNTELTSAKKSD